MDEELHTPVVFCVFNRPEHAQRVLEVIRRARPRRLWIIADGPKAGRDGDAAKVQAVRTLVESGVDWPCDLRRVFARENMGCARRISSGLDAVFAEEQEAIILEDDCLPLASFFPYCEELLARFRDHPGIGVVSGSNHQYRALECGYSYYCSIYNHCWGWATWRRAWRHFDLEMKLWRSWPESALRSWVGGRPSWKYWRDVFDRAERRSVDTWDYPWTFACWRHGMCSILPRRSLVTNIGIGRDSTHTTHPVAGGLSSPVEEMQFPMRHPPTLEVNMDADAHTESVLFQQASILKRILRRVRGAPRS